MSTNYKDVTIRTTAFHGESVSSHKIRVLDDGSVQVWDASMREFTSQHVLSAWAVARARQLAIGLGLTFKAVSK